MALVEPLHGFTFALLHLACMEMITRTVPAKVGGNRPGFLRDDRDGCCVSGRSLWHPDRYMAQSGRMRSGRWRLCAPVRCQWRGALAQKRRHHVRRQR